MSNTYFNISDKLRLYEFDGLLDQYGDAAAAYSLRKLRSGYTGSAIRVRRSSDNTERDMGFWNNELDTIALLDWVNEEILHFDADLNDPTGWVLQTGVTIAGGAINFDNANSSTAAFKAYGAIPYGKVRVTFTVENYVSGNITWVNFGDGIFGSFQSSDGTYVEEKVLRNGNANWGFWAQSFTGSVTQFKVEIIASNGFVHTWYDQSANANHAVQSTATAQPKIVDAGVVVTDNGKPTILYDDVDDVLLLNSEVSTTDSFRHFIVADASADGRVYDANGQSDSLGIQSYRYILRVNIINTIINSNTGYNKNIYQVGRNSSDEIDFVVNDSSLHSGTVITGESGISQIGSTASIYGGTIYEIITYNSDATISSLDSVGIRDNINTYYSIY